MSAISFFFWLVAFAAGVVVSYFVPETTLSVGWKFIFTGAWGAVLGFVLFNMCKKKVLNAEIEFNETLNSLKSEKFDFATGLPISEKPEPEPEPEELPLPKGSFSAKEAIKKMDEQTLRVGFPLEAWKKYSRTILKDRPVPEVLKALEELLPKLFPNAAGILYRYAGTQADLHKVLSFGDYVISDDVIRPAECASFDAGDIVVTDYSNPNMTGGCTHLHHHPKGVSFCAPIEGIEEHFGILTLQTDAFPDNESMDDWLAKVSFVATTFGQFVANQNLNVLQAAEYPRQLDGTFQPPLYGRIPGP